MADPHTSPPTGITPFRPHEPDTRTRGSRDAPPALDEDARRRFEAAWLQGQPRSLADFLPPPDRADYLATLEELVHIDLEFGWKPPAARPRHVEDYLAEFPCLDQPAIVLRLIRQEHEVRAYAGTAPDLVEFQRRFPAADLTSLGDEAGAAPGLPALPGFDLLRVLGRGGMGVVYQAREHGLNRLVAVKMVLAGAHAGEEARRRFRVEAEAVARFQHPNIVQVHEVGEHDGCPYLVLEYVAGGSLAQHLAGTPQPPEAAARLVEALARAVDAVHQCGIVHRDLKPHNVLLGAVPKISDFGLAKGLPGQGQDTVSGAVLGTPSYMAPEQAAGRVRELGPAVDVYALGAILYEMLTGRPPFKAATVTATIAQVLRDEPVAPRALQPAVPRDLEVICLCCLHKDPGRRYATAAGLANDLGRFLRGEPIRARPVGRPERVWRWCRRNPREAGLLAALAVVVVVSFAALTWLYLVAEARREQAEANEVLADRERRKAEWNAAEAEDQRKKAEDNGALAEGQRLKAEKNQREAKDAVDFFFTRVSTNDLLKKAGLQPLRKTLLREAVKYYRGWLQEYQDDPTLAATLALTWFRVGLVEHEVGTKADSIAAFRQARALYQQLARADPKGLAYERELLYTTANLANLEYETGPSPATLRTLVELRDLFARRAARAPNDVAFRADLARAWNNLGSMQAALGRLSDAAVSYGEALKLRRQLAASSGRTEDLPTVARTLDNLSKLQSGLGKTEAALALCAEALAIWQDLVRKDAQELEWQHGLAAAWERLGREQLSADRPAEARKSLEKARDLIDALVDDNRQVVAYRATQGFVYQSLARWHHQHGEMGQALPLCAKARAIRTNLVQGEAGDPTLQAELAATLQQLGTLLREDAELAESRGVLEEARTAARKVVQRQPDNVDFRHLMNETCHALAMTLLEEGKRPEALAALEEALLHGRVACDRAPEARAFRRGLAVALRHVGVVSRGLGNRDRAAAAARERKQRAAGEPAELFEAACDLAESAVPEEAVAALREALRAGLQEVERLRTDERLAGLRGREDFKQLLPK